MSVAEQLKDMTPEQADEATKEHLKRTERLRREVRRELDAEEYGRTADPEILTLRERLARPRPVVHYRIQQVQGIGHRVLLAAQFKAGKTTLAANLARSVLDGDAFLGVYHVDPITGVVALFDFEMSPHQLDDWYAAQDITNDDRLLVIPMRGSASAFNITDRATCSRWAARLRAAGVTYLILDCLRPVLDALGLSEHTEAGVFLTALDALLHEAGIPEALVIQHMGHKNERARGDSRLLDWPDVGWTLVRASEDDPASPRFFKAYGRDVDVPETQLDFDTTTRRLTVVSAGRSRTDAKVAAALDSICTFVAAAPTPPSGRQIEDEVRLLGHTQKAIRNAIREGVTTGVLVEAEGRNGGRAYRSTMADRPGWIPELGVGKA